MNWLRDIWGNETKRFWLLMLAGIAVLLAVCAYSCSYDGDHYGLDAEEASLLDEYGGALLLKEGRMEVSSSDAVLNYGRYVIIEHADGSLTALRSADIRDVEYSL